LKKNNAFVQSSSLIYLSAHIVIYLFKKDHLAAVR